MGIGRGKALNAAALKLSDIDLIELNGAFAVQVLASTRERSFGPPTSSGSTPTAPGSPSGTG
jgi:acetyl-CoA acetyltransferase